jgi:hypothetical protein
MKTLELHFWNNGHRFVGIDGDHATVSLNVDAFSPSEEQEHIERATELFRDAFGQLWGAAVIVYIADETGKRRAV